MKRSSKRGFTLIELVTTMALSGVFFTMALDLYNTITKAYLTDKKYDELYFDYNVQVAKTKRFLKEHYDYCEKPEKYEMEFKLPLSPLHCKALEKKRYLVYFQGYMDSGKRALVGFSTIIGE